MCDLPCEYDRSAFPTPPFKGRPLRTLLLYCWQTEYDKLPYRHFKFGRADFEQRMSRPYHCIRDLRTIVNYLQQRNLRSVSFSGIVISNWDVTLLRDFVHALIPLWKIELKLMHLPLEFFVMLRLNAPKMEVMTLSLAGTRLSDNDVRMLREFLLVSNTLRHLNVAGCSINQYNLALLADGVHKAKKLRSLNASRVLGQHLSLDTEKMSSLIDALLMQNKLVELTLEQCELLAEDMSSIAAIFHRKDCILQKLNLACNKIGPDGALSLMSAIAAEKSLQFLDISCNNIGSHGGESVAQYLSSCKMLKRLYLNYNEIGAEAINLILLALKKPNKLRKLQLYGNKCDARTAMIVRRQLDAGVLKHEEIDLGYTYDEALQDYRVIHWK